MDPEKRDGTKDETSPTETTAEPGLGAPPAEGEGPGSAVPAETTADPSPQARREESHDREEHRTLKSRLRRKEHEVKDLRKEAHDLKDKVLRLAAEMDNQRKRLDREKSDYLQFALAGVLKELLDVYDNFERALKSLSAAESPAVVEGITLIAKQYQEVLRKRGVTEIEAEGRPFDPTVHSAIASEESAEVSEPVIGEVFQKGYRLNDRLLRPALVKVLVPAQS
jgi:molecular chaperone GrpE